MPRDSSMSIADFHSAIKRGVIDTSLTFFKPHDNTNHYECYLEWLREILMNIWIRVQTILKFLSTRTDGCQSLVQSGSIHAKKTMDFINSLIMSVQNPEELEKKILEEQSE